MSQKTEIKLSKMEIQSGLNRVNVAEGLVLQLPKTHEGRNTWLLNYGIREEAQALRKNDGKKRADAGYVTRKLEWNADTDCLNGV